jgi:hypothetical protein
MKIEMHQGLPPRFRRAGISIRQIARGHQPFHPPSSASNTKGAIGHSLYASDLIEGDPQALLSVWPKPQKITIS